MCKNMFSTINVKSLQLFKKFNSTGVLKVDIVQLKRACLEKAINDKQTRNYGYDAYLRDFALRVDLLQQSKPFCEWCAARNVDTFAAATHVVHLGANAVRKAVFDDILEHGQPQLDFYEDWANPIFTKGELAGRLRGRKALPARPGIS